MAWSLGLRFTILGSSEYPACFQSHWPLNVVHRFPPKNAKSKFEDSTHLSTPLNVFPSATLAQSEIWDEPTRSALKAPRYKKKEIDERKSKVCSLSASRCQPLDLHTEHCSGYPAFSTSSRRPHPCSLNSTLARTFLVSGTIFKPFPVHPWIYSHTPRRLVNAISLFFNTYRDSRGGSS